MRNYTKLDKALQDYLIHTENHWLMNQTLLNAQLRREVLESLPISEDAKVLDIGTGFGAVSFDLAFQMPLDIEAIDIDDENLQAAANLKENLYEHLDFPGEIHFNHADLYKLPYEDQSFDFAIAWFVFQHLKDPIAAIGEIRRVLRPGGFVCLVDADDQFAVSYPEPAQPIKKLRQAIEQLQRMQGGDRFVGRKLPSYLNSQGLHVAATVIKPQTSFVSHVHDVAYKLEIELYLQLKKELIDHQVLSESEFDQYIAAIEKEEPPLSKFESNAQFIVLGQKP